MSARTLIGLTVAGMLAAVGLLFGGSYVLSSMSDCSGKELAILERYPHYGNRRIATYPWTISCSVRYTTKATRKEVVVYYDDLLDQHGWETIGYQTMYIPKGMRESQARGRRLTDLWELPRSAGGVLASRSERLQLLDFLRASEQGGPGPSQREGHGDGFGQRPSDTSKQLCEVVGI
jgi:hypothetical protein